MSNAARIVPISTFQTPKSPYLQSHCFLNSSYGFVSDYLKIKGNNVCNGMVLMKALTNNGQQGSILGINDADAVSIELKPILNETQFDHVIAQAQQLDESLVILWYVYLFLKLYTPYLFCHCMQEKKGSFYFHCK